MRISAFLSIAFFAAMTAAGGVVYDYKTVITGPGSETKTLDGTMTLDGPRMRMTIAHGDKSLYKDGMVVLSTDGGLTQRVFDPAANTYFEMTVSDLLDTVKHMPAKPEFREPDVSVHKDGDGEEIEGLPTRKVRLEMSATMAMKSGGREFTAPFRVTWIVWMTDRIDAGARRPLLANNMRTGIEMIDKMIESAPAFATGFPLKSTMTQRLTFDGRDFVTTMTSTTSNVQQYAIDDSVFALPAEAKKVPNPLLQLLKEIGQ